MKKIVLSIVLMIAVILVTTACTNKQVIDFTFKFDRAILKLPNGEIVDGVVQSWKDFEDGDQIQVKIDGTTYLLHSTNIVLIAN